MKKVFNWILELVGLRKVIRFEQLSDYNLNELITELEIKRILKELSDDVQFHVGIEHEIPESDKCGILLIQRDPVATDFFLVCKTVPFGMTPWRKIHIDNLVQLINATKKSECRKFEKWKLLTQAIEGKTFW